jgi:hypothetical protein
MPGMRFPEYRDPMADVRSRHPNDQTPLLRDSLGLPEFTWMGMAGEVVLSLPASRLTSAGFFRRRAQAALVRLYCTTVPLHQGTNICMAYATAH